jgi:hypothetical protein
MAHVPSEGFFGKHQAELRGIGFGAVLALAAGAVSRSYFFGGFSLGTVADYVPAVVILICLILSYGRHRKAALIAWLLLSIVTLAAVLSEREWGEVFLHGAELHRRRLHGYSYLSDWLFAFGSSISLAVSIILICTDWNRAKP